MKDRENNLSHSHSGSSTLSMASRRKGGINAAKNLGKQGRVRRASKAAKARWKGNKKMDLRNVRRRRRYAERKRQEKQ